MTKNEKIAATEHDIFPLLAHRWSPRAFSEASIDRAVLQKLFEAARWAPSASNSQPWAFMLAERGTDACSRFSALLAPGNQIWAAGASCLGIGFAQASNEDGSINAHARYDLGQAMAHLTVQAASEELFIHQMAGFDVGATSALITPPSGWEPVVMFVIGYLGDADTLPERLREREKAPRTRKPAGEFVFADQWGEALFSQEA